VVAEERVSGRRQCSIGRQPQPMMKKAVGSVPWPGRPTPHPESIVEPGACSGRCRLGRTETEGSGSPGMMAGPDGEKQRARSRGGHRGAGTRLADGTGAQRRVMAQHGTVLPDAQ
jgi:hypothetical protein